MLNSKQEKCISLMVTGSMKQKDIAKAVGVTETTICNWKKKGEFMDKYTDLLKEEMRSVAAKAFKTEVSLLRARSEMVRLMAAKDILDRAGFKAVDKMDLNTNANVVIIDDMNGDAS